MKGIKSLNWHIKRAKKNCTAKTLYPKPIKQRSMCAQWPWDWLDLHLRVDRNGSQMNEIRSMCRGDTVTFDRRNKNKSFKFHLKTLALKKKKKTQKLIFVFLLLELIYVKEPSAFSTAPFCPVLLLLFLSFSSMPASLCSVSSSCASLPPCPFLESRWSSRLLSLPWLPHKGLSFVVFLWKEEF